MVSILSEPSYTNSVWCGKIHESLTNQLRQKRIPFCEVFDICPKNSDAVFIIASNLEWTTAAVKNFNSAGVCPIILCNQMESIPGCVYNCVCSDVNASMKLLSAALCSEGKKSIALYGINTNSISDICRTDSLMAWKNDYFDTMQVFTNNGSLKKCFEEFYRVINGFDAAICANDLAAVSLVRNIKKHNPDILKSFSIISCSSSGICEYYRDNIRSLNINYEQYGRAAIFIYESMQKHAYLSGITARIMWSFDGGDDACVQQDISIDLNIKNDEFYSDEELHEMLIVERILSTADNTDKLMLNLLIRNAPYEEISQRCYLSESSIKYRIKKLINESKSTDKSQMIRLLKKYISEI